LGPSLSLLERWIVVDHLAADIIAVDSLNGRDGAIASLRDKGEGVRRTLMFGGHAKEGQQREEAFVQYVTGTWHDRLESLLSLCAEISLSFTLIPADVFTRCIDILIRTSRAIKEVRPEVHWTDFGWGPEKEYGEILEDFYGDAGYRASLASSNFGVERTLVYYETAAAAGIPLLLHPDRYKEVESIDSACCDAYKSVKELLRTTFEEPIRSQLECLGHTYKVPLPPLVSKLIEIAGAEGLSILEAAKEMKDSKDARAFWKWLGEIQGHLAQGTIGGKVEALKMLDELRRVASDWTKYLDPTVGVTHKRRQLTLSWVPRIGALLDLLDKPTIRDSILNRKGYLSFVSSWFNDSP
jgi:hypothetical protein